MNNLLRNVPFIDSPGLKDIIIQKSGAEHTAKEIAQQPGLWIKNLPSGTEREITD